MKRPGVDQELRRQAAELARDIRTMELKGIWLRRDWNNQVRQSINGYISRIQRFKQINQGD